MRHFVRIGSCVSTPLPDVLSAKSKDAFPGLQKTAIYNFRRGLATFLIGRGKDVKTIQGQLRHAKVTATLDLYSQAIDAAKPEAQEDIALAIKSTAVAAD